MRSSWKSLRYQLEWLGVRLLAAIVPRLPRPVAVKFARIAGALAARLDLQGRRVALSNLEAAFGDRFSAAERARITRQSYQQFAGTMIDLFWSPRLTAENFRKLIDLDGWDEFARTVGPTGPCIIATCHYGNFEWFSLAAGYAGLRATIISQEFRNPRLDPIFNSLRQRSGHQMVPREGAIVRQLPVSAVKRSRFPIAFAGVPQNLRAMYSFTIATIGDERTSRRLKSRPATSPIRSVRK